MELNVKVTEYEKEPRLLVIVATNMEKILDSALLSRFERVEVPLPDFQMCIALFTYFLRNFSHDLDEHIPQFAQRAVQARMSCRDIRKVVSEAYWQCKVFEATQVLQEAMEDEIEIMSQKKMQEREEKEKIEEEKRKQKELTEMQYQNFKTIEEERVRDMISQCEFKGNSVVAQMEKIVPIAEGIGEVVHVINELKEILN